MKKILCVLGCLVGVSWNALAFDMDRLQIHGFASQGYLRSNHYDYLFAETEDGTFEFNEFGLNVMSSVSDNLRVGMQVFARDLGEVGNDDLTVDWALGDYRYRNWLGIRAGKLKRPLGFYNQSRDIDAARTGVFLPLSVYNETYRTEVKSVKGISLYGTLHGGFEYQTLYGTLDSAFESELLSMFNVVDAEVADDAYVLHLIWNTPLEGLRFGGTYQNYSWAVTSVWDDIEYRDETELTEWVVGIEYSRGDLTVAAEYDRPTFDYVGTGGDDVYTDEYSSEYYYGLLAYRLTDWLELAGSYAVTYLDRDDREGDYFSASGSPKAMAWSKDLALSARFDLNEFWIVKLEGHWINGLYDAENFGDDEDPDENGFLGAAKVTFSF